MKKILITDDMQSWINFHTNAVKAIFGEDVKIDTAISAQEGYSKLLENKEKPYDYLITDMQMESDFLPKMAGEWLIEQAKTLPFCYKTKIIIISASYNIKQISEIYGVDYIPKSIASVSLDAYKEFIF